MDTNQKEKKYYEINHYDVIKSLDSDFKYGLTDRKVLEIREKDGLNELVKPKKRSLLLKFFDQINNFMIYVLLGAALVSFVSGLLENKIEADTFLILAIVLLNAIIGLVQEGKADKALESIKALSSPNAKVIRNGIEMVIKSNELVVGDIVILDAGDFVPGDLRLIETISLKIDESALTGEAVPVEKNANFILEKDAPLGDRINLAYMSTVVTYGRGKGVVVGTGMNTEIGKIATLLGEQESEQTPLQKSIANLGKILAIICLIIVGVIFLITIIEASITNPLSLKSPSLWIETLLTSVALAVAAIPEGLPAIITIVLAIGMQNLVKEKAIMRTLPAVETLGSTTIICSDKTGTLTQNKMDILKVFVDNKIELINDNTKISSTLEKLILFGVLNNDTKTKLQDGVYLKIGDPTETAFIDLASKLKYDPIKLFDTYSRDFEYPFDSDRKMMTTFHIINSKLYACVKGAPDVIFSNSIRVLENDIVSDKSDFSDYENINISLANEALRVLAFAYKEYPIDTKFSSLKMEDVEKDLTFVGLVGMKDPARPEVKEAIKICKKAGITTIMITGDHKNTALAIAKDLDIFGADDIAITGKDLDNMSDTEFLSKYMHIKVYARVSPENKVRIVSAWKSSGLVVAMTGDGVNDAPSIKKADIGIAMGITGTEVAKGAADMILTDDNFATIINAVSEGRTIFANIKKAIHYLLSCNVGEILAVFLGTTLAILILGNTVTTLTAVQLLWVNIVTDSLMAIALGLELKEKNIMSEKPRDSRKSIFAGGLGLNLFIEGIIMGLMAFGAYIIGYKMGEAEGISLEFAERNAETMCFMVLSLSQLVHAFNCRSDKESIFSLKINKWLVGAFAICIILQLLTTLPVVREVFNVNMPNLLEWLIIAGITLIIFFYMEIKKLVVRIKFRNRETV
ncbi:MAG: cation-translocating P-type ATPase [Acholeplasmatales bacterium]|jgi:Ca2+-transporting ATPase|nr:cation-translocating P-type ATPase [Acholeplasmatales bacterium]